MTGKIYPLILAGLFLVHNLEEYLSYDQMPKIGFGKKLMNRSSFLFAITSLSLLVILFSVLNCFYETTFIQNANTIVLFSLSFNAVQHGVLSLWYRKVVAGTPSALFLILPFSLLDFTRLCEEGEMDFSKFITYSLLSPIVMVGAIMITLWIGNCLQTKNGKKGG